MFLFKKTASQSESKAVSAFGGMSITIPENKCALGDNPSNSDDLIILDPSPSNFGHCRSFSSIEMSESVLLDLEEVLSAEYAERASVEPVEYGKAVKFDCSPPEPIEYQVSDPLLMFNTLRRKPKKLSPITKQKAPISPQEMVSNSPTLQSAVASVSVSEEAKSVEDDEMMSYELPASRVPRGGIKKLIGLYLEQKTPMKLKRNKVHFDKISVTESNQKIVLLSSKGLSKGVHEWSIQIQETDVDLQEIGVIGTSDIGEISVADNGVFGTSAFGPRVVYGSDLGTDKLFYASLDGSNRTRCLVLFVIFLFSLLCLLSFIHSHFLSLHFLMDQVTVI